MRTVWLLVLTLPLSGCFDADGDAASDDLPRVPGSDPSLAFTWDHSLTDCVESVIMLFMSLDEAQGLLPDGWVAADFADLFGLPAPTGQGVLMGQAIDCKHIALTDAPWQALDVVVGVQPPSFAEAPTPADLNVLSLHLNQADEGMQALYDALGASSSLASTAVSLAQPLPDPADAVSVVSHSVTMATAAGDASWSAVGAVAQPFQATSRTWSQTDGGILMAEWLIDTIAYVGPVLDCAFSEGTMSDGWGSSCLLQPAASLGINTFSVPGRLVYFPGASVV